MKRMSPNLVSTLKTYKRAFGLTSDMNIFFFVPKIKIREQPTGYKGEGAVAFTFHLDSHMINISERF